MRRLRGRLRVHYSAEAEEQLATYHRRRQGMLRLEIQWVAASAPAARFVHVRTPMDIAACEVLADQGVMLVYAVIPRRELLRKLWGAEVDEKVRRRKVSQLTHGRWY